MGVLNGKVRFEQILKRHETTSESLSGRGNDQCKCPETGAHAKLEGWQGDQCGQNRVSCLGGKCMNLESSLGDKSCWYTEAA